MTALTRRRGPRGEDRRRTAAIPALLATLALASLAGPPVVAAHGLSPIYQSPLPLAIYLAGAAITVGLSFAFVLARDVRAGEAPPRQVVHVPLVLRLGLRAVGLLGWAWILLQGIVGGSSAGEVATLFIWVYGWVGVAMVSALIGPVWQWLDPFATLHDIGAWLLARLGIRGWAPTDLPRPLRTWPAVLGLGAAIWLELVEGGGTVTLTVVLAGYTLFTLAMMAQFGRDTWRAHGETFSVWFGLLNRLAPIAPVTATELADDPETVDPDAPADDAVARRPFASGLLDVRWTSPEIVLVAFGVTSIIFDGLSQTAPWASVFGSPSIAVETLLLAAFLGLVTAAALGVARAVAPGAIGAGLLPIAVGYLVAHYITFLLIDGQRILVAISDPLQQGWDLFGTAFHEPSGAWLPAGLVWTVQLGSVVGGHMLGAWAGHVTASREIHGQATGSSTDRKRERRDLRHRRIHGLGSLQRRNVRVREIPLALMMVGLTTLTLWSLGQAIVREIPDEGAATGRGPASAPGAPVASATGAGIVPG
jgi:hypothetical protein